MYAGSCPVSLTSFPSSRRQEAPPQTLMHTSVARWRIQPMLLMGSNGSHSQPAAGEIQQVPWGHNKNVQEPWIPITVQCTHFILSIVRSLKSPA